MSWNILNIWMVSCQCEISYEIANHLIKQMTANMHNILMVFRHCEFSCDLKYRYTIVQIIYR
jgi:hypothetical protein